MTEKPYHQRERYFLKFRNFYQKKQVRLYTELILTFFTISFFLFFSIRPTLITIASLLNEIKEQKTISQRLEKKVSALKQAQANYQQIKERLYLIDEALPENSDFSLFIRQLEALAAKNKVTIDSLQYEPTPLKGKETAVKIEKKTRSKETNKEENFQGIYFALKVSGQFESLKAFYDDFFRFRRLIVIDNFIFKTDQKNNLVFTLNAEACYLNPGDQKKETIAQNEALNQ